MSHVTRLGRLGMTVIAMTVGPVSAMEQVRIIYQDSTGALKHFYNLETGDNRLMWNPQVAEKELVLTSVLMMNSPWVYSIENDGDAKDVG